MNATEILDEWKAQFMDFMDSIVTVNRGPIIEEPIVAIETQKSFIDKLINLKSLNFNFLNKHIPEEITNVLTKKFVKLISSNNRASKEIIYLILIVVSTTIVLLGSIISINSIPTTALPPTKVHELYDPLDNNIKTECDIEYIDKTKTWRSMFKSDSSPNNMSEKHVILLPVTSAITLISLYYLITHNMISLVTKFLRYHITFVNLFSVLSVSSYLLRLVVLFLTSKSNKNSKSLIKKYRFVLADDDDNDECIDGGKFAVSSGIISNFNYMETKPDGEELGFKDSVDFLNKDENEGLKQFYYKEFTKPKNVKSNKQIFNIYFDWILLFSLSNGLISSYLFLHNSNNWIICNMVSVNISIWSISQMNLKNLKSGVLILSVLFFYDIFFVFGTKFMVTVGKNLELPVKILLPIEINETVNSKTAFEFALLGLGDIVLPGMFISLCHKFDIWKWHSKNIDHEFHLLNFRSYFGRYFITALISYMISLVVCMTSLSIFETAQPALLYIVPVLLISVVVTAHKQDDLSDFWNLQYDTITLDKELFKEPQDNKKEIDKLLDYFNDNTEKEDKDYSEEQEELDDSYDDDFNIESSDDGNGNDSYGKDSLFSEILSN